MNRLKEMRNERNYTEAQIAELLNIKQQQYSRYEVKPESMKKEIIAKICQIYNVSADYILELTDEKRELN